MEFNVEYDNVKKLCTVRLFGQYTKQSDTHEVQQTVINTLTRHGCQRVLIDMTQADVSVSIMTIFNAGNPQGKIASHLRDLKSAFLYPEITEKMHFFEDVAVNQGFNVKVFDQMDKALEWLQE